MNFEQTLTKQMYAISKMIVKVYHLTPESAAMQALKNSAFYRLLSDEETELWKDSAEVNFRRYQNEIEYGAWDKRIT